MDYTHEIIIKIYDDDDDDDYTRVRPYDLQ